MCFECHGHGVPCTREKASRTWKGPVRIRTVRITYIDFREVSLWYSTGWIHDAIRSNFLGRTGAEDGLLEASGRLPEYTDTRRLETL